MSQEQIEVITLETLLEKVGAMHKRGCRLVQISATQLADQVELTYSFDLDSQLSNLRLPVPSGAHLPSITPIFGCAVLYENEIHDLFGVPVDGMSIDFKGNFYRTAIKHPFGSMKAPCAAGSSTCATSAPKPQ